MLVKWGVLNCWQTCVQYSECWTFKGGFINCCFKYILTILSFPTYWRFHRDRILNKLHQLNQLHFGWNVLLRLNLVTKLYQSQRKEMHDICRYWNSGVNNWPQQTQFVKLCSLVLHHRMFRNLMWGTLMQKNHLRNQPWKHGLHCMQVREWRDWDSPLFLPWSSAMDILMDMHFQDIIGAIEREKPRRRMWEVEYFPLAIFTIAKWEWLTEGPPFPCIKGLLPSAAR